MSSPIIYNEQEQKLLADLERNAQGFVRFKEAVLRGLHIGQDSRTVADLVQFLHELSQQAASQIQSIQQGALARANTLKEEAKSDDEKKAS